MQSDTGAIYPLVNQVVLKSQLTSIISYNYYIMLSHSKSICSLSFPSVFADIDWQICINIGGGIEFYLERRLNHVQSAREIYDHTHFIVVRYACL